MKKIGELLFRIEGVVHKQDTFRKTIQTVLKNVYGVSIPLSRIHTKEKHISIKVSGTLRAELFLRKEEFIHELQKTLNVKNITLE